MSSWTIRFNIRAKFHHSALLLCFALSIPSQLNAQLKGKAAQAASDATAKTVSLWVSSGSETPIHSNIRIALEGSKWTLVAIDSTGDKPTIRYSFLQESAAPSIPTADSWRSCGSTRTCSDLLRLLTRSKLCIVPKFNYPPGLNGIHLYVDNGFGATLQYSGDIVDIPGLGAALNNVVSTKIP